MRDHPKPGGAPAAPSRVRPAGQRSALLQVHVVVGRILSLLGTISLWKGSLHLQCASSMFPHCHRRALLCLALQQCWCVAKGAAAAASFLQGAYAVRLQRRRSGWQCSPCQSLLRHHPRPCLPRLHLPTPAPRCSSTCAWRRHGRRRRHHDHRPRRQGSQGSRPSTTTISDKLSLRL